MLPNWTSKDDSNIEPDPITEPRECQFWKIEVDEAIDNPVAMKNWEGKILAKNYLKEL